MAVIDGLSDEELQKLLADIIAAEGGTVSEGGDAGRVSTIDSSPALATGPRGRNLTLTPGTFDNPEIQGSAAQVDQILGGFGFDKATNPNGYNLMRRILFPDVQDNSGDGGGTDLPGSSNVSPSGSVPSSRPAGSIQTGTPGGRSVSGDGTFFDTVSGGAKNLFDDFGNFVTSPEFGTDVARTGGNFIAPGLGAAIGTGIERSRINAFNDLVEWTGLGVKNNESFIRTLGENVLASFPGGTFLRDAPEIPDIVDAGKFKTQDDYLRSIFGENSIFTALSRTPKKAAPKIAPAPKPVAVAPPRPSASSLAAAARGKRGTAVTSFDSGGDFGGGFEGGGFGDPGGPDASDVGFT